MLVSIIFSIPHYVNFLHYLKNKSLALSNINFDFPFTSAINLDKMKIFWVKRVQTHDTAVQPSSTFDQGHNALNNNHKVV